jgi:hypothetical protein
MELPGGMGHSGVAHYITGLALRFIQKGGQPCPPFVFCYGAVISPDDFPGKSASNTSGAYWATISEDRPFSLQIS